MRRCTAALLRNSSTKLRYSRLCPCVYARLRFGSLIRRCTQSLILVAGKSFRSRTPRFNKTIRTVADFPSADLCLAVYGKSFPSCTKQKHPTDVECFCFGNRRRRVVICSSLRPCRSRGVVLPGAQSLLSAAGKCKPFRRSAFLTKLSAPSLIFPRGVLFSHIFCKRKNSHKRASFFFWKPASTYSPGHVSASYIALFFTAPQNVRRVARPSRDVFLLRRENLFAPVLRVLIKLSVRSLIFPPQIVYLAVHGKSFPSCTFTSNIKQKAHTFV